MIITINNTEIELKPKMRAYLIYELIAKHSFNPTTLLDILIYFYSVIMANSPALELTFDEFVDYLDEHLDLLNKFREWTNELNKIMNQFHSEDSKKK